MPNVPYFQPNWFSCKPAAICFPQWLTCTKRSAAAANNVWVSAVDIGPAGRKVIAANLALSGG
jgi:hypothetical protein